MDTSTTHDKSSSEESSKLLMIYTVFLLMFQTVFRISDRAMDILFSFLFTFLKMVGKCLSSGVIVLFSSRMAHNLAQARKQAGGRQKFVQYACCPKCHSIYPKEECIVKDRKGNISSASCSYIRFPYTPTTK